MDTKWYAIVYQIESEIQISLTTKQPNESDLKDIQKAFGNMPKVYTLLLSQKDIDKLSEGEMVWIITTLAQKILPKTFRNN